MSNSELNSLAPQSPRNTYLVPTVIEQDGRGERAFEYYAQINPADKNAIIDEYEITFDRPIVRQ